MTINEFLERYYLHDSGLNAVNYDSNNHVLVMDIDLCNWMQLSFVEGQPEMLRIAVTFTGVSHYSVDTKEICFEDEDILTAEQCNGILKIVIVSIRGQHEVNVISIIADAVEVRAI